MSWITILNFNFIIEAATKRKMSEENNTTQTTDDFLSSMKFSVNPHDVLSQMKRTTCPGCKKKYKYFCYKCMKPVPTVDNEDPTKQIPQFSLPLKVIVIQHKNERKGKSTAIHAKIVCPESVEVYEYPDIPQELVDNAENALLLYPSPDAITVEEVIQNNARIEENKKLTDNQSTSSTSDANTGSLFKYVVFIDSTWQQSKSIFRDARLEKITRAKITAQKTKFWRYQQHGDEFLATIEAIYFFFREYSVELNKIKNQTNEEIYNGEYDDLLFFYSFQYDVIQKHYKEHPDLKFTTRKTEGYIQYENNKRKRNDEQQQSSEENDSKKLKL
jgi:DTW domain-containing protein YfiP